MYKENTTGTAAYIYGPTGRLALRTTIDSESHTFYYHTDNLGSTRLITDENRDIVSTITYHPFGESSTEEGSEDYKFSGKERDSTGLYYYGARYYDPELGRFLTRDTAKGRNMSPQTLNPYSYCLNNPLKYVDPDGRDPVTYQPKKKEKKKVLIWSHAPQNLNYEEVIYDYGEIWFWACVLNGITLAACSGATPLFTESFHTWLSAGFKVFLQKYGVQIAIQILIALFFFLLGLYIADDSKDPREVMTPIECLEFFDFLKRWCDERGIDSTEAIFRINKDDTITVMFPDGSTQTFRKIGDQWQAVPTPPQDTGNSETETETETETNNGSDDEDRGNFSLI